MDSHIQLNQGRMNYFRNNMKDGKQTYCLSLSDLVITSQKIGELGTEPNYYSIETENTFSKYYETPLGEIIHKINKGIKFQTSNFPLLEKEKEVIQKFCAINILRSITSNKVADLNFSINNFFSSNPEVLPKLAHELGSKIFESYNIRYIYNNSSEGFVLPSFGYYRAILDKTNTNQIVVIPVDDKIAVILDKEVCDEYSVSKISDEKIIMNNFNYFALFMECVTNRQFLIAKTEQPLINLRQRHLNKSSN